MDHVLTFHPNGTATTLYTDKLPLRELGTLAVQRASFVEFNNSTGEWEVRWPEPSDTSESQLGAPAFSNPSREECLRWERDQLNQ